MRSESLDVTVEIENWVDDFRDTRLQVRSGSLDVTVESENWVDNFRDINLCVSVFDIFPSIV